MKSKLIWYSANTTKIKRLKGISKRIIKDLLKIKNDFSNPKINKDSRTILVKLTLAICGDAAGYKVYSNQMYPKTNHPTTKTRKAYSDAYKIIWKHFKWDGNKIKDKFKRNTEWLFDVHWFLGKGDKRYTFLPIEKMKKIDHFTITTLPLIAESEFSNKNTEHIYRGVRYDFQKLLIANAELRLMIFRKNQIENQELKNERFETLSEYFLNAINSCKFLPDKSKFLFTVFDEDENQLQFSYYEKGA